MSSKIDQPKNLIENFSLAEKLCKKMVEWDKSYKAGPLIARVVGFATLAFCALADAFIHAALTLAKSLVNVSLVICPRLPDSNPHPLVHLTNTAHSIYKAVMLPFLCLLDPSKAWRMAQLGRILDENRVLVSISNLQQQYLEAETSAKVLHVDGRQNNVAKKLNTEEELTKKALLEIESLKNQLQRSDLNPEKNLLNDQQIASLKKEISNLQEQLKLVKQSTNASDVEIAQKLLALQSTQQTNGLLEKIAQSEEREKRVLQLLNENEIELKNVIEQISKLEASIRTLQSNRNNNILILDSLIMQKEKLEKANQFLQRQIQDLSNQAAGAGQTPSSSQNLAIMRVDATDEDFSQCSSIEASEDIEEIPPAPPIEDFKTYLMKKHDHVFEELEAMSELQIPETPTQTDKKWWFSEEAINTTEEAQQKLMTALQGFETCLKKEREEGGQNSPQVELKIKHAQKLKVLFDRRNKEGLMKIKRQIEELDEILTTALSARFFNQGNLTDSLIGDMGESFIQPLENIKPDQFDSTINNMLEYMRLYALKLQEYLGKLRELQKQKQNESNPAQDSINAKQQLQQDKENQLKEEREQRAKGFIPSQEALEKIQFLKDATYKGTKVDVEAKINEKEINVKKANMKICTLSGSKIADLDDLKTKIQEFKEKLKEKYYKPDQSFNLLVKIVDELNGLKFL